MKMPRRPFYPPVEMRPDIFGLPYLSLLGLACEDEPAKRQRISTVEKKVLATFEAAKDHLGEDAARRLFVRATHRSKRGQNKLFAPDRDARLLKEHDALKDGEPIASLARRLRHAYGTELGSTAAAIAAQIRKLVKERTVRDRKAAFEARRWRMALSMEEPTLLSMAGSEK
jgi:hypothetical protein